MVALTYEMKWLAISQVRLDISFGIDRYSFSLYCDLFRTDQGSHDMHRHQVICLISLQIMTVFFQDRGNPERGLGVKASPSLLWSCKPESWIVNNFLSRMYLLDQCVPTYGTLNGVYVYIGSAFGWITNRAIADPVTDISLRKWRDNKGFDFNICF